MSEVDLRGLRGTEPLAFMASLTVLDIVNRRLGGGARLSWRPQGTLHAVLHLRDSPTADKVVEAVTAEREELRQRKAVLVGPVCGAFPPRMEEIRGRDPLPKITFDDYRRHAERAQEAELKGVATDARWLTAFVTELGHGSLHAPKPDHSAIGISAFYLLSRRQSLYGQLLEALERSDGDHIRRALLGPWERVDGFVGANLDHRAVTAAIDAPLKEPPKRGVPGATWLALQSLRFFPVVGNGHQSTTKGWRTVKDRHYFVWPLWSEPLGLDAIAVILDSPWLDLDVRNGGLMLRHRALERWSVYAVLAAPVIRKGEGTNLTRLLGSGRMVGWP